MLTVLLTLEEENKIQKASGAVIVPTSVSVGFLHVQPVKHVSR